MTESRASGDGRVDPPKMTMRVYTVSRTGVVTRPRATVLVPHDYRPQPEPIGTLLPDCACPIHRAGASG
jgi:hypothetical protein